MGQPLPPDSVRLAVFKSRRGSRGYREASVDAFLDRVVELLVVQTARQTQRLWDTRTGRWVGDPLPFGYTVGFGARGRHYVVRSPDWDNGAAGHAGAAPLRPGQQVPQLAQGTVHAPLDGRELLTGQLGDLRHGEIGSVAQRNRLAQVHVPGGHGGVGVAVHHHADHPRQRPRDVDLARAQERHRPETEPLQHAGQDREGRVAGNPSGLYRMRANVNRDGVPLVRRRIEATDQPLQPLLAFPDQRGGLAHRHEPGRMGLRGVPPRQVGGRDLDVRHLRGLGVEAARVRAAAGALVIGVEIGHWLLIVTLLHASQNAWSNLLSDNSPRPFYFTVLLIWVIALLLGASTRGRLGYPAHSSRVE